MPFTHQSYHGSSNDKVGATTLVHTLSATADLNPGDIGVFAFISDNTPTADGPSSEHDTLVDSQGNTWTKREEYTDAGTGVAAGCTVSLWTSTITTKLTKSVDTLTLTMLTARTAKACILASYVLPAGADGFNVVHADGNAFGGGTDEKQIAVPAIAGGAVDRLFLAIWGMEAPNGDSPTVDPDYTAASFGTSGGSGTENVKGMLCHRATTLDADTISFTPQFSRDTVAVAVVLEATFPSGSPPAAPSGLTATASGRTTVDLAWTDNSADEDEFEIHMGTSSPLALDGTTLVDTVPADTESYQVTGLTSNTEYFFQVVAKNASGSNESNEDSTTTWPDPGTAEIDAYDVDLTAAASANATAPITYSWRRSTSAGFDYTNPATDTGLTTLNATDPNRPVDVDEYYRLVGTDADGRTVLYPEIKRARASAGGGTGAARPHVLQRGR